MIEIVAQVAAAAFLAAWLIIHFRRERSFGDIPELPRSTEELSDKVSIILPVRNERRYIHDSLGTLLSLECIGKEIIVVDDNSTDGTWEAVKQMEAKGLRVIRVEDDEPGWMGKCKACHVGYLQSSGVWLLFTDADTELAPSVLRDAVQAAKTFKLDFLSVYPRFRFNSFLHKAALPVLLTGFYLFGRPHLVQSGQSAFAFGSFMLFRREAYEKIGGHAVVRDALLEDRALALHARRHGVKTGIFKALDRVISSWNEDSRSLWNGMLRLFTPLGISNPTKTLLVFMILATVSVAVPILNILTGSYLLLEAGYLVAAAVVGWEARRHSASFFYGFLWPIGVGAILAAAATAFFKAWLNPTIRWRNRVYTVTRGGLHEKIVFTSSDR
ncbi:MAG: glycosyltransferase family 2 protein [Candidatus Caldarchaeum sp.]